MRYSLLVGAVVVLCVAGLSGPVAAEEAAGAGVGTEVQTDILDGPSDWCPNDRPAPDEDQLGWENGCWWDADLQIDRSDGLNDTELRAVVGRSMARVERVRNLEFQRDVPVEIISREQHRSDLMEDYNVSTEAELHENVVLEGALMVGEDTDAVAVQRRMFGSATLGYYDTEDERIAIVSDDAENPEMNEITLSQELFHALQDNRWNISSYDRGTWEDINAVNGIVEGDGNYVDRLYQERCEANWSCLEPQSQPSGGDVHFPVYVMFLQSYSDGPPFVEAIRETSGWDGVDAVYENPPTSSEQTIHPDRYPDEDPVNVTVEDTSTDTWRIPEPEDGPAYGTLGEAGLFSMFLYPASHSGATARQEMAQSFYNAPPNQLDSALDPYNYTHHATEGWAGDKLVPYVRNDSAETNETGYVWKLRWDSGQDAEQFVSEYYELLQYWGASPVDGHVDTFRIPDDQSFGDAFSVTRDGDVVTIVNAPTVEELPEVQEGAAPEGNQDLEGTVWAADGSDQSDDDESTAREDPGESEGNVATETTEDDGSSDGILGPGFTAGVAVLAVAGLVVLVVARRS